MAALPRPDGRAAGEAGWSVRARRVGVRETGTAFGWRSASVLRRLGPQNQLPNRCELALRQPRGLLSARPAAVLAARLAASSLTGWTRRACQNDSVARWARAPSRWSCSTRRGLSPGRLAWSQAAQDSERPGDFREALSARGWTYLLETPSDVELAPGETRWPAEGVRAWVGNSRAAPGMAAAARRAASEAGATLTAELGLDHFEGRSWRGFHHHACLVMLAYGFRFFPRQRGQRKGVSMATV